MSNASVVYFAAPDSVIPGAPVVGSITFSNAGADTWIPGSSAYRVGTQRPQDSGIWGSSRLSLPAAVPSGAIVTVPFSLVAPQVPGVYTLAFQMLQEGVAWFGEIGWCTINVGLPPVPLPPQRADINDLVGAVLLNSNSYAMPATERSSCWVHWTNITGHTLYIKRLDLWAGAQNNGISDMDAQLTRSGDQSLLARLAWDHYANPTAPGQQQFLFDPYFTLLPNEQLVMRCYTGSPNVAVQYTASIACLYVPPTSN